MTNLGPPTQSSIHIVWELQAKVKQLTAQLATVRNEVQTALNFGLNWPITGPRYVTNAEAREAWNAYQQQRARPEEGS